ncbi:hypothetical protein BpHYR1_054670 [Brachionus plicatilis]|uniref:Uncharacterized protein n=1 Tax=Brachionus plicatilis TaxID=10195 RepID=A0A3M7S125_BRAPC|nr:hypothetical protein BpHYR1_054670 [Brachionus plicatilis]
MRVTRRYLIVVVVVRANRCIWREKEEYRICIENLPLYLFCSKVYQFGELKNLIDKSNMAVFLIST